MGAAAEELIAQGANVTAPDRFGWLAAHWAAHGGHADLIQLLAAAAGSPVNARTDDMGTRSAPQRPQRVSI